MYKRQALRFLIKGEGYQAEAVNSPAGILEAVESRDFDAVVMDLNYTRDTTSGQEGLDLLNRLKMCIRDRYIRIDQSHE